MVGVDPAAFWLQPPRVVALVPMLTLAGIYAVAL